MLLIKLHRRGAQPGYWTSFFYLFQFKLIIKAQFWSWSRCRFGLRRGRRRVRWPALSGCRPSSRRTLVAGLPSSLWTPRIPRGHPENKTLQVTRVVTYWSDCVSKKLGLQIQFVRHQIAAHFFCLSVNDVFDAASSAPLTCQVSKFHPFM